MLIDARHGIKKNDEAVLSLLDKAAVSYQLVLTKADKVKAGAAAEAGRRDAGRRSANARQPIRPFSPPPRKRAKASRSSGRRSCWR